MADGDPVLEPLTLETERESLETQQEILRQLEAIRKGIEILIALMDATQTPPSLLED